MNGLVDFSQVRRLLCIGAHPDDIELGAGGLVRHLCSLRRDLEVCWVVVCAADGTRAAEAEASARAFAGGAAQLDIVLLSHRDAYLPWHGEDLKDEFERLKTRTDPDLVLTHRLDDEHQDHRLLAELTWNTWRDHSILAYEVHKWEGDLGRPNVYLPLSGEDARAKAAAVHAAFPSQHDRRWFDEETFLALMRVRGVECNADYAEAFYGRKLVTVTP